MDRMCELDVSAGNFTIIDWDVHQLWLNGLSVNEAANYIKDYKKTSFREDFPDGVSHEFLVADVSDNYRLFSMLESALLVAPQKQGSRMHHMGCFQFADGSTKQRLVEAYYSLDNALCRELLGKKLTSRLRKDLDEISEKTGLHLKSCRRQFDNVKRVFKVIEEMPGHYVKNVETQFGLSTCLAEKYATVVFASSFRLDISRRKLSYLTFDVVMNICLMLIDQWMVLDDGGEPLLDKEFLSSLRDIKNLGDREKEHRNIVCHRLNSARIEARFAHEVENNFRSLTRGILSMAQSLSSQKEIKDFFVILIEKIVDPFRQMHCCNRMDVDLFLRAYVEAVTENVLLIDNDIKITFQKFMCLLRPSILVAII